MRDYAAKPYRKGPMAVRNKPKGEKVDLSGLVSSLKKYRKQASLIGIGIFVGVHAASALSTSLSSMFDDTDRAAETMTASEQSRLTIDQVIADAENNLSKRDGSSKYVTVSIPVNVPDEPLLEDISPDTDDKFRVQLYQDQLLKMGFDLGRWGADGDFGFQSVMATLQLQYQNDLPLTGTADHATQVVAEKIVVAIENGTWKGELPAERFTMYDAVKLASAKTGTGRAYLGATAFIESSFKPEAKAKTTSAKGLMQFTDDSIIKAVFHHGKEYGLDGFVDEIEFLPNGRAKIDSPALNRRVMEIRNDPLASLLIAGETAAAAKKSLQRKLENVVQRDPSSFDKKVGDTEQYFAHFLGTGGASQFFKKMAHNETHAAKDYFPTQASRNKPVFYKPNGKPRSFAEIYALFDQKMERYQAKLADNLKDRGPSETMMAALARYSAEEVPTPRVKPVGGAVGNVTP